MKNIASVFLKAPESWGYRGDPFMWDALGWALSESLSQANQTSGVLENAPDVLTKAFRSLAEGGVRQEDGLMLDWLPKEGMSGSVIHLETWNNRLLPEIQRRLQSIGEAEHSAIEYHPAEHRFRFAAWAASTAARSSRKVCTFPVSSGAKLLRTSRLRWLSLGSHWLPRSREAFDAEHQVWCEEVLRLAHITISTDFTYGISAKLVNCYLKTLFLNTMVGSPFGLYDDRFEASWDASTRFLHPPIDRLLMEEAAKRSDKHIRRRWKHLIGIGWSRFNREEYEAAIGLSRLMVGGDVAQIEACWSGFQ